MFFQVAKLQHFFLQILIFQTIQLISLYFFRWIYCLFLYKSVNYHCAFHGWRL